MLLTFRYLLRMLQRPASAVVCCVTRSRRRRRRQDISQDRSVVSRKIDQLLLKQHCYLACC